MNNFFGRREGNVVTVFLDASERPLPFTEFDRPPLGFPSVMTVAQASVRYPGIQFIERPGDGPAVSTKQIGEERLRDYQPPQATGAVSLPLTPKPAGVVAASGNGIRGEFERMLLAAQYAKGRELKELKRDLEAVGTFLIATGLCQESELIEMKEKVGAGAARRFAL
jgi:hypothetical protein